MAFTAIEAATLSQQYSNLLLPVIQQGNSRTAPSTMFKTGCVGQDIQVLDYISKITNKQFSDLVTVRDIDRDNIVDHVTADSRWLPRPVLFESVLMFNEESKLLRLVDMESGIRDEQIKAINRDMDILFCNAAGGKAITSISDVAASGNVPAHIASPYDMVALPASQIKDASAKTPTSLLDEMLAVLDAADVDTMEHPVYCYINSEFKEKLFNDPRYDNWNNMGTQVLADGELTPYRGVRFVRLSDTDVLAKSTLVKAAGTATMEHCAIMAAGKPICTGIWSDVKTTINQNPQKDNAWQLQTKVSMASTRLDEVRIVIAENTNALI